MSANRKQTEKVNLTREEIAKRDIGNTSISRGLSYVIGLFFVILVLTVPVIQLVYNHINNLQQPYSFITGVKDALSRKPVDRSFLNTLKTHNTALLREIDSIETLIDGQSILTCILLPPVQKILLSVGYGNEKVYIGRDGWLFYKQSIEHLTQPGFLEDTHFKRVISEANELRAIESPNPLPAIIRFHNDLLARNIQLIVVPVPAKPEVYPEYFSASYNAHHKPSLKNSSYDTLVSQLRSNGVTVFDMHEHLIPGDSQSAAYLATDTHWRPQFMQIAAEKLGSLIKQKVQLDITHQYIGEHITLSGIGDLTTMLKLPSGTGVYSSETITAHQIQNTDGSLWQADPTAEILLLGDSFTNIFTVGSMGWGEAAGFAPQLSFTLNAPIDTITRNDEGAYAARQMLQRDLNAGSNRLQGKKIVIWEFAARELSFGNWKVIPLPEKKSLSASDENEKKSEQPKSEKDDDLALSIVATITQTSTLPDLNALEYPDCMAITRCRVNKVINGVYVQAEILVALLSIKDYTPTNAAKYRVGQQIQMRLIPFSQADESLKIIRLADDIGDYESELFIALSHELVVGGIE